MKTTGRVNGIISNIVIVKADGPVGQNEILSLIHISEPTRPY